MLRYALKVPKDKADRLLKSWDEFVRRAKPEIIPPASQAEIVSQRHLIRHRNDVPVLLAALKAQPDWLLTTNRDRFTDEVAVKCGLRIADPEEWFTHLISRASET